MFCGCIGMNRCGISVMLMLFVMSLVVVCIWCGCWIICGVKFVCVYVVMISVCMLGLWCVVNMIYGLFVSLVSVMWWWCVSWWLLGSVVIIWLCSSGLMCMLLVLVIGSMMRLVLVWF